MVRFQQFLELDRISHGADVVGQSVPGGRTCSVLGPILFIMFSWPGLTQQHCMSPHLYAGDTQIYGASGPSDVGALLQKVTGCLTAVAEWMLANRLQLNSDKTEFMRLTSPRSQHWLPTSGPLIGSNVVSPSATVRDLGIFIDEDLTMKTHVQQTASRCFATLHQLRSIRCCIPTSVPCFCTRHQQVGLLQQSPDRLASHSHPASPVTPKCSSKVHFQPETLWPHHRHAHQPTLGPCAGVNYIQGGDADVSCTAWFCITLLGVVVHMCRRRAAPTQAQVRLHWTAWRSNLLSVNHWRSCLSCCWSKRSAKQCYVGLVAVGVQEQAENILVLRPFAIDVAWLYVCMSVYVFVGKCISRTKTTIPIEMQFGLWIWVGPTNHVLG